MHEPKFHYGPIAKGVYGGLWPLSILVAIIAIEMLGYYLIFLLFLGIGLRPVLEKTGMYDLYIHIREKLSDRRNRRRHDEIRDSIDRKARDERRETRDERRKIPTIQSTRPQITEKLVTRDLEILLEKNRIN